MTLEDWIRSNCGPTQYGEQDENRVDLSLIRVDLKLTPEQRLVRGDRARENAQAVKRYGEETRRQRAGAISLDDLIKVKEHIGRAKDRESLFQLLAIKRLRTESKS